ncbi:MAG: hypothetical protein MNPFHGCM_00649 [Gemmatimonadaceae bacterium]|nr:hypothetical protein [Gemmatimonadaceae bacterium]
MANAQAIAGPEFDPGAPYAIELLSRALQRLTRNGTSLCESIPVATFFAPQRDRWSPAEHVRHLTMGSRPLRLAYRLPSWLLRARFGAATSPSRTFDALRADYLRALESGASAGRFSPRPERAPADPEQRRRQILARWASVNDSLTSAWGTWRSLELDRIRLPHPILGRLTAREMAIFTVYHTAHHLTLLAGRLR